MKADWVASIFLSSGYAEQFERGNPAILAGMSGIELARVVVEATYKKKKLPEPRYSEGLSPEYWAGWALAEYQWYSGMRFKDIFERVKLSEIIPMYSVYHEMDISKFIETMDERCSTALSECRLKSCGKAADSPKRSLRRFPASAFDPSKCTSSVSTTLTKPRRRRSTNCRV